MKADFKKWLKGRELKLMSEKFMLFTSTEQEELLNQFAEDYAKQKLIEFRSILASKGFAEKWGIYDVIGELEMFANKKQGYHENKDES